MDHRLICTWLGLPPTMNWPPDYYTLLGLPPGEEDLARIEQQAQERLARIRCYQIKHPEQATEALNLLAQALVCLTDPEAKRRYDRSLRLQHAAASAPRPIPTGVALLPASLLDADISQPTVQLDWRKSAPPPDVLLPAGTASTASDAVTPLPAEQTLLAPPAASSTPVEPAPRQGTIQHHLEGTPPATSSTPVEPAPAPAEPAPPPDPFLEAARSSPAARRGLGTRHAVLQRLLQTRALLRAWDQVESYLAHPRRLVHKPTEALDLTRKLTRLDLLLQDYPPLIGQPGGPGYRLVMLAREEHPASALCALGWEERKALARDWKAGRNVLQAHRRYLGELVRQFRRQSFWQRLLYPARAWINDHPVWTTLLSAAALTVAAWNFIQYLP